MIEIKEMMLRLTLAFVLGGIIGLEREKKGGWAGLRTHILVCLGSCLIMVVSVHIFDVYRTLAPIDPGRIAAGVVTGIGFLGAGTIIRSREGVKGLTTAASIWMSSAIGLSVGSGFIAAAVFSTFLTYLCLSFLKRAENINKHKK
ncbi:MAG: MgtC/SapB family protein [Candidatus Omnitrophica bacterium]|nr:MgtC/SapB family protein [Candidatus Omnitrophota bacterium]